LLAAVERDQRQSGSRTNPGDSVVRFGDGELAAASHQTTHDREYVAAAISITVGDDLATSVTVILIVSGQPAESSFDPGILAELTARSAIAIIRANAANVSRDFWQARNSETIERLNNMTSEKSGGLAERVRIERALTAAEKLRPRNRFAGVGALFAQLGPFDAWILALIDNDALRVSASSGIVPQEPVIDPDAGTSALAECFLRQSKVTRAEPSMNGLEISHITLPAKNVAYVEDQAFTRFIAYVCIPLANGAIALATNKTIDAATVTRVETFAARVSPLIAKWLLEAETDRLRGLVRNLGLRMFGAIDSERARIARDMHDHQAQLLTAARLGIEAGPDEARGIFKQLETALRTRVRELKPPTLGRSTLAEGLRFELRRLAASGLKTRLFHADRMDALTRPVQQLCFQVAREALANIVHHADATRVEIDLKKCGPVIHLSILDNGMGIPDTNSPDSTSINDTDATHRTTGGKNATVHRGIGLDGLGERLELMGGRLRIESKAGSTRLIAEIPVAT
jgi:signal transduction histidine kinase